MCDKQKRVLVRQEDGNFAVVQDPDEKTLHIGTNAIRECSDEEWDKLQVCYIGESPICVQGEFYMNIVEGTYRGARYKMELETGHWRFEFTWGKGDIEIVVRGRGFNSHDQARYALKQVVDQIYNSHFGEINHGTINRDQG